MRNAIQRSATLCLLIFVFSGMGPALGQAAKLQPPEPLPGEAANEYLDRLKAFFNSYKPPEKAPPADVPTQEVAKAVAKKTTATAAPEGFADRVNESISDFLPLFQFAVNTISSSDDKKSVTAKFNRITVGPVVVALSATVTQPELFPKLSEAIVEQARDEESKLLLADVGDFSDITSAAEVSFVSKPGGGWATRRKLFGRNAETYKTLIGEYLVAAWDQLPEADIVTADRAQAELAPFTNALKALDRDNLNPLGMTFQQIREKIQEKKLQNFDLAGFQKALVDSAKAEAKLSSLISETKIAALPALVDNQPQIVLKLAHRSSADVIGPDSTVFNLSYEMGTNNFNTLLRKYGKQRTRGGLDPEAAKVAALKEVVNEQGIGDEDRITFSLSYKDVDSYHLTREYKFNVVDPDNGQDLEQTRTATVDLGRSRETRGKLVWTRYIQFHPETPNLPNPGDPDFWDKAIPKEQRPQLTVSLEGVDFNAADLHDQLIGKVSYVMPVSGGMSVPVTLVWANRSELVKDQDHLFSAHVGISYKLNPGGD